MKNSVINLLLILSIIFIVSGCKFSGLFSRENDTDNINRMREKALQQERERREAETRDPIPLEAKMVEGFPAPSDAEIIPNETDRKKGFWVKREIKLKSGSAVYDVANFYRKEMIKNGWKDNETNDRRKEDPRSILAFIHFSNDEEETDVNISSDANDGSTIEIRVSENRESRRKRTALEKRNLIPMPACADGSNMITTGSSTTLSAVCAEDLSSIARFYDEELPKADWELKSKTGNVDSGETVTMTYTKENKRAIIMLVREGTNSTSVNVRVSN